MSRCLHYLVLTAAMSVIAGCVDHGIKPLLLPVGSPAQPAKVVHYLCLGDADEAYDRAKQEFAKRAAMYGSGVDSGQMAEQESQANSAAHMKYTACAASEGYRVVYPEGGVE